MNKVKVIVYLIAYILLLVLIGVYFNITCETISLAATESMLYSKTNDEIKEIIDKECPDILKEVKEDLKDENEYAQNNVYRITLIRNNMNKISSGYVKEYIIIVISSIILLITYTILNMKNKSKINLIITIILLVAIPLLSLHNIKNLVNIYMLDTLLIPALLILYTYLSTFIIKREN